MSKITCKVSEEVITIPLYYTVSDSPPLPLQSSAAADKDKGTANVVAFKPRKK